MAGAYKHMIRSHYSSHNPKPFGMFDNNAQIKKYKKEQKSFVDMLFHRTTNK